jgi:hypothetical protein
VTDWSPADLLPGLWAATLAMLLVAILKRWYDRVPRRILAAFALPLLVLFGPTLLGGKLLLPLDNLRGSAPFRGLAPTEPHGNLLQGDLIELVTPSLAADREAYGEGRWPLRNPHVGSGIPAGMPLLADPQAQALQPFVLLAAPLPLARAAAVTAFLRVFVALVFSFLWMRRQGLDQGPALAGSLAYGLGGFLLLWLGWPIANPAALLPLVLYALTLVRQRGGRADVLLLAVGTLALLLGGHPETIAYVLALAAAFALSTPSAVFLRRSALAVLLAAAVAAPALLPAAELMPRSLRASRLRHPAPTATEAGPLEGLSLRWLPIAAPNAYGNSRYVDYWGLSNTNEDASGFVGTAALLAALLTVSARRRFPQERLLLGVAAVCLLLLSPLGVESRRVLLLLSFSLVYLAACTLQRLRDGDLRRWPVVVTAVALGLVLVQGTLAHPDPADPNRLAALRFGWLHWQVRFLVLATLLLVFAGRRRWAPPLVAALIAAELLLAHVPANPPMPQRLAFPVTPAIRFLQTHPGRMAALGRDFPPNLATLYGLTDVRVYNPMAPADYLRTLEPITVRWWGEKPELGRPEHPLWRRLGVRYLLTAPAAPDTALPAPWRPAYRGDDAWIQEQPGPFPELRTGPYRSGMFGTGMLLAALGLALGAAWLVPPPERPTGRGFPRPPGAPG